MTQTTAPRIVLHEWLPLPAGVGRVRIFGRATISIPDVGMVVHAVAIHQCAFGFRAVMPRAAVIRYDVHARYDGTDDLIWKRTVTFESDAGYRQFSEAVIAAIRAAHPGALEQGAGFAPTVTPQPSPGAHA